MSISDIVLFQNVYERNNIMDLLDLLFIGAILEDIEEYLQEDDEDEEIY